MLLPALTISSNTSPCPSVFTVSGYFFFSKVAVTVLDSMMVSCIGFSVGSMSPISPLQPMNNHSPSGSAVSLTIVPESYSVVLPASIISSMTSPSPSILTESGYFFFSKFAVRVVLEDTVIVLVASMLPSDQLVKTYSPCGVAVTFTVCRDSYSPPVVDTVPPSPADKVIVYLAIGAGGGSDGGKSSSEEQDNTKEKAARKKIIFSQEKIL